MRNDIRIFSNSVRCIIRKPICDRQGSILIGIIVTMAVVATLGTAMVTLTNTSTFTQVGAFDAARAYYLAEAGGRYAIPIISEEIKNNGDPLDPVNGTIARLDGKTFTMVDGEKFRLALSYTVPNYNLESVGILRQGANTFEATRKVVYVIVANAYESGEGSPIVFEDKNTMTDNLVTVAGGAKVTGGKLKVDKDLTELGLKWDGNEMLPDLAYIWSVNDGLLGYSLQVKLNMNPGIREFVAGLSFRVNIDTDSSYGFSILKRSGKDSDCGAKIPAAFCAKDGNGDLIFEKDVTYEVLWKKVGGVYSILDYRKAQVADGIVNDKGELKAWSTLIVQVEESYITDGDGNYLDINGQITTDPEARTRQNAISAFVQGEDDADAKAYQYKLQTTNCSCSVPDCSCIIHWDYERFNPVEWTSAGIGAIADSSLTSADFATIRPEEVGLHYLGDTGERFFDDFAFSFGSGGGGGGSVVRY